jgi:hypothetical protein
MESSDDEEDEEDDEPPRDDKTIVKDGPPDEDMDPERSLEPKFHRTSPPCTVHWDPHDRNGRRIGWKVRIEVPTSSSSLATSQGSTSAAPTSSSSSSASATSRWLHGRVVRYDPYTRKHKIKFEKPLPKGVGIGGGGNSNSKSSCWIWIRNTQHNLQLATRIVWAHVKGYAWWPALVVESLRSTGKVREGYVSVEFFGSAETATLRDAPDCVRPFGISSIDDVVAKHKKKRNARAYQLACEEYHAIRAVRNDAALFYAERALEWSRIGTPRHLVNKRVEVHRTDVNYPYGDTLLATVRSYSFYQKKWLLSYDYSNKTRTKYDASWINLGGKKECAGLRVLDDKADNNKSEKDGDLAALVPFMVGFEAATTRVASSSEDVDRDNDETGVEGEQQRTAMGESSQCHAEMAALLSERCRGCVEYWKKEDFKVQCRECQAEYHIGCADPPISTEAWQRMMIRDDADGYVCSRCVTCRGCYQKDTCFGCHVKSPQPPTLSFPKGEPLNLCSACAAAYDDARYCPNCAHSWDHDRYEKQRAQLEYAGALFRVKGKLSGASGLGGIVADTALPPKFGSFSGDEVLPTGAKVDPSFFYPESTEWGFSEVEMLVCDGCDVWVHAGCSGLTEDEYNLTSDGKHPVYSKEFLCRMCCRNRCKQLIELLNEEDKHGLFAAPVTEKMAPNYQDVIKNPMDLETMLERAVNEEYLNYAWVREMFELMVLNALTFNRPSSAVWHEAKRYYRECLSSVFARKGKAAPPGKYADAVQHRFDQAEEERKKEEDRVQVDETVEKKDLVAGSLAVLTLPKMRDSPPDQSSCLAYADIKLEPVDAFYCSWMECCYVCGSSGAMDTMLFCVDCGEAYHTFCANAPIHSMDAFHIAGWRCPNCKICEISGEVPQDENRMLFCEMCDRAFSTDLLDPPLSEAPPGLWICGQCVDCSLCQNILDGGRSLKHWSQDPSKCFRCGGCGSVVDDYMENTRCIVSKKRLRSDDSVVQCSMCNGYVIASSHESAKTHLEKSSQSSRSGYKAKVRVTSSSVRQSLIYSSHPSAAVFAGWGRQIRVPFVYSQAWRRVGSGTRPSMVEWSGYGIGCARDAPYE